MKIVTIPIKIAVHDNATHIAFDSNGEITEFDLEPEIYEPCESPDDGFWVARHPSLFAEKIVPINWRESLIEVECMEWTITPREEVVK
jgi:hypothetical protein